MKRILVFGDSNTWGFNPERFDRYPEEIRWTSLLQKSLGNDERSLAVSRELKDAYKVLSDKYGTAFLAASDITEAGKVDGQHLTAEGHHALYEAVLKVSNHP